MRFARLNWIQLVRMLKPAPRSSWVRTLPSMTTTVIAGALLCLSALNIQQRASWSEIAHGTAADRAGSQAGDVLLMIDGRPVERVEDVVASLHASARGAHLRYTILRIQAKR